MGGRSERLRGEMRLKRYLVLILISVLYYLRIGLGGLHMGMER